MEKGTYIRTKNGNIYQYDPKVIHLDEIIGDDEIVRTAPNTLEGLLEIIEVGDYVNGEKVDEKNDKSVWIVGDFGSYGISIQNFESIVTKEKFESIKFKVGE